MILAWASSFNARAVSNARPASVSRLTARYKNSRHMLCPQKKRKNQKIFPTKMQSPPQDTCMSAKTQK